MKGKHLKCPYLCNSPPRCKKMIEKGLEGEISDFDMQHFCDGNPVNCYFYRLQQSQKDDEGLKQKIAVISKH